MTSETLFQGVTILLVDADDKTATYVRDNLARCGYAVRRAASARSALATVMAESVDLILLEMLLPDADGLALCRQLSDRTSAPIIMLNTRAREVDRLLAAAVGASDVVTKPLVMAELLPAIRAAVADSAKIEQVTRSR